jgi:hypothetical protein
MTHCLLCARDLSDNPTHFSPTPNDQRDGDFYHSSDTAITTFRTTKFFE